MAAQAFALERPPPSARRAVELRVRGRVQGVGFRPTVWRLARELELDGEVRNDGEGVLIRLAGPPDRIEAFRRRLERAPPPLARIEAIETAAFDGFLAPGFAIVESGLGGAHTQVAPDAKVCDACAAEIAEPEARRFGYGLTNCTHCGPRLSIVRAIPYDRARTTMAGFPLCAACRAEYEDPADRRFHAEPTCCPACGPKVRCLALPDGREASVGDPCAFAAGRLRAGDILAVKGLGGYQLACDATNAEAVARLRAAKLREGKPFALMARDLAVVRRHAALSKAEAEALRSPAAPIVLLRAKRPSRLPEAIAPGLGALGFMLATTPLHRLLLQAIDGPVVMTSGNLSGEPQIIDDEEALKRLRGLADHVLLHDRPIANRLDDSVVRLMDGQVRLIRRARGYAPAPIALPEGFRDAPEVLALGGELKATFCLVKDGQAIVSQHQGDLEDPLAFDDYRKNLGLYRDLFDHAPEAVAVDAHPDYLSAKLGREMGLTSLAVHHHHAHLAACLAEAGRPLHAPPVLGIVLDGLGWGEDALWGGELLKADYGSFRRMAALKPVALPGGAAAMREPWRNLYAHVREAFGWADFNDRYGALEPGARLADKPCAMLGAMIAGGINAPEASSCGRLFDAVAAALGLCFERQAYEGDAAARLESLALGAPAEDAAYPFAVRADALDLPRLDPAPMWRALFEDLAAGVDAGLVAARFHRGLARALAELAARLCEADGPDTVALSGGCFQNRLLLEETGRRLRQAGLDVLSHRLVPAGDGGLSLGQAAIAAARLMARRTAACA